MHHVYADSRNDLGPPSSNYYWLMIAAGGLGAFACIVRASVPKRKIVKRRNIARKSHSCKLK